MFDGGSVIQSPDRDTRLHRREGGANNIKPATKTDDRMLGSRFELKYLVNESKAEAVAQFIKPYLQLDRYSKLQRGGDYPITSLYLDSDDFRLCWESMTGVKNRFKLRIRSYTDEPDYPRFFEIKRRVNAVILKSRARVMDRDVPTLLAGLSLPPQNYSADIETLNQFQLYMNSIKAKPKILIRYLRRAWEGDSETRVRVTFDRKLCYCATEEPEVRLGGRGWQWNALTEGSAILEIKFTNRYPAWLNQMIRALDLQAQPISKYATSIAQSCRLGFCAPRFADF
ncbi:MAG: polyphosphate polymerase domain-containing protein [Planctomycetota bacterium]|nr:polyphosphate polymerase domain-containing protein [Planctomycetota bacterium]